jgi:hypothetical protein
MDGLSVLDPSGWEPTSLKKCAAYAQGNALGWLSRSDKQASVNHPLAGRLYLAKSGWLLLSVPNAFVRGVYDALVAPGAELPLAGTMNVPNVDAGVLNAHISVMTADEVQSIGADKINERGHMFYYGLGPVKEIPVTSIEGVSKVWVVQVASPTLAALRKSYGLTPLPKGNHPFHITIAARRKHVMGNNTVSKFDTAQGRGELKAAELSRSGQKVARSGQNDLLPGGKADNLPDRDFSSSALAEGAKHEHEHVTNDQIAKEIAKDHLLEDPTYYEKVKKIEKAASPVLKMLREAKEHSDNKRYEHKARILRQLMSQSPQDWVIDDNKPKFKGVTHKPTNFRLHADPRSIDPRVKAAYFNTNSPYRSVYVQEMLNQFNRRIPITYDHNLPLFKNIQNQLLEVKNRGDFILRTRQNAEMYRAHLDPMYRQQRALDAFHNRDQQMPMLDRVISRHGNDILGAGGA